MIYSVKCNHNCIGCGNCERTCKGIFRLTYTVHAEAVGRDYEKHRERLLNAYYSCPVQAIEMEGDDPTLQIAWFKALILEKKQLSATVMEVRLQTALKEFKPGQYVTVRFKDDIGFFNRAYSVVELKDGIITLCVTLVQGGRGSSFFSNYEVGNEVEVTEPKGDFCLQLTSRPKVFVGTGTGLAPLVAMMESCPDVKKTLYFGQRKERDLFYLDRMAKIPNLDVHTCLDFADDDWTGLRGRVTEHFINYPLTPDTEIYTCGSDPMMNGLRDILKKKRHSSKLFFKESFNGGAGAGLSEAGMLWRTSVRNVHVYASLAMSVLFLFFGFSGFLASRPALFNAGIRQIVPENVKIANDELAGYLKAKLPTGVALIDFVSQDDSASAQFEDAAKNRFNVKLNLTDRSYEILESHPLPVISGEPNARRLAEVLAKRYPGRLDEGSIEEADNQLVFTVESVWVNTSVTVDKIQARYEIRQDKNRWAAALVQLHRGKKSGPVQRVLIDLTGLFMVVATLTGVVMGVQSRNPVMRTVALILVGFSITITAVMIMNR